MQSTLVRASLLAHDIYIWVWDSACSGIRRGPTPPTTCPNALPATSRRRSKLPSDQTRKRMESGDAGDECGQSREPSTLHKDFRRYTLPRSLGRPAQTKDDWLKESKGVLGVSIDFDVGHTSCYSSLLSFPRLNLLYRRRSILS